LYVKARAGQLPDFTGISAPYEAPETPQLCLDSLHMSVDELAQQCWSYLRERGDILTSLSHEAEYNI